MKRILTLILATLALPVLAEWSMVVNTEATPNQIIVLEDLPLGSVGTKFTLTTYTNQADAITAAQAAIAAGAICDTNAIPLLTTLTTYPTPETLVPMVDATGLRVGTARILVDATTLETIAVVDTASPQRPWAVQREAILSNRMDRAAIIAALKALRDDSTNAVTEAQAIDPSAWTGAQKTQVQMIRKASIDTAKTCNELRKILLQYWKAQ